MGCDWSRQKSIDSPTVNVHGGTVYFGFGEPVCLKNFRLTENSETLAINEIRPTANCSRSDVTNVPATAHNTTAQLPSPGSDAVSGTDGYVPSSHNRDQTNVKQPISSEVSLSAPKPKCEGIENFAFEDDAYDFINPGQKTAEYDNGSSVGGFIPSRHRRPLPQQPLPEQTSNQSDSKLNRNVSSRSRENLISDMMDSPSDRTVLPDSTFLAASKVERIEDEEPGSSDKYGTTAEYQDIDQSKTVVYENRSECDNISKTRTTSDNKGEDGLTADELNELVPDATSTSREGTLSETEDSLQDNFKLSKTTRAVYRKVDSLDDKESGPPDKTESKAEDCDINQSQTVACENLRQSERNFFSKDGPSTEKMNKNGGVKSDFAIKQIESLNSSHGRTDTGSTVITDDHPESTTADGKESVSSQSNSERTDKEKEVPLIKKTCKLEALESAEYDKNMLRELLNESLRSVGKPDVQKKLLYKETLPKISSDNTQFQTYAQPFSDASTSTTDSTTFASSRGLMTEETTSNREAEGNSQQTNGTIPRAQDISSSNADPDSVSAAVIYRQIPSADQTEITEHHTSVGSSYGGDRTSGCQSGVRVNAPTDHPDEMKWPVVESTDPGNTQPKSLSSPPVSLQEAKLRRTPSSVNVTLDNPKFRQYSGKEARIRSYNNNNNNSWPTNQKITEMSEAGFFYAGTADVVQCFYCGGEILNWGVGDDPAIEHARWFPQCSYINHIKGEDYVRKVKELHDREMRERQEEAQRMAKSRDEEQMRKVGDQNKRLCKSCQQCQATDTLQPCGHLVVCDLCASQVTRCPECRKKIETPKKAMT